MAGRQNGLDLENSGTSVTLNSDATTMQLFEKFNVNHLTVLRELKRIGKSSVVGKCVSKDLPP